MNEQAMQIYEEGRADIVVSRPPEVVLEEAMTAAKALQKVLAGKKKPVIMNNEQYLEFEDWQTVARFFGVTVRVASTEFLDYGGVKGFLARADALRSDGQVISSAEAMCMNDEEKWSTRAKYEWQGPSNNRQRVKVGEDPVPLFQLRSMAQTRACAKALRNVFAWVVVLAGYKPTPAEEMDGVFDKGEKQPEQKPPVQPPQEKKAEDGGKTDDEKRGELTDLGVVYASAKGISFEDAIKEFTVFKGSDGAEKFKEDPKKLSGKWLNSSLGRARELAKPFMEEKPQGAAEKDPDADVPF